MEGYFRASGVGYLIMAVVLVVLAITWSPWMLFPAGVVLLAAGLTYVQYRAIRARRAEAAIRHNRDQRLGR